MSYDSWKTTDPRDSEPDWDGSESYRDELDDWDRADLSESEIAYLDERASDRDKLAEAKFWKDVNDLAIEFPEFSIAVIPEASDDETEPPF